MSTILAMLGAFVLYILLLPLFGVIVGFVVRVVLPYSIGALAGYFLFDSLAGWSGSQWLFVLMSVSWVLAVLHSRACLKRLCGGLAWYEGHYFGVINTLTLSQRLRTRRASAS